MRRTKIVTGIVVFSCLMACGKPPAKYTPPPPAPPSDPKPSACATKEDRTLDPKRAVQRKTIDLKRQRQRIVRRDCDKKVISDQMELIQSPSQELAITPAVSKESGLSGSAYNRTTCSQQTGGLTQLLTTLIFPWAAILESSKSQIKVVVDSSPTFDHMHVRKDVENFIDYSFTKCTEKVAKGTSCPKYEVVEQGTLILTVNYSEPPDIETPREVIDCKKEDQKKP